MKTIYALAAIYLLSLSCCGSVSIQQKSISINSGNTREEVIKIMGTPENRQTKRNLEAWQYCKTSFGVYNFVIVWFADGKVSGTNTLNVDGKAFSFCTSEFRTIRWEDAPTISIEHRNR